MDIHKFFASVSWDVLITLVNKTVACKKTKRLIEKIVTRHRCFDVNGNLIKAPYDIVNPEKRIGLPIGNLTSQLFANVYLNELDHFVKESLHVRWYARYMDDFLIIHPDRKYLKMMRDEIGLFLSDKLKLSFHPKKVIIQNVKDGLPFVGYLIFYDHIKIRGKTLLRMRRRLKKRKSEYLENGEEKALEATFSAIRGHLGKADAYGLAKNLLVKPAKLPTKPKAKRKKNKPEQLTLF